MIREGMIIAGGSVEELSRTGTKRVNIHGQIDCEELTGVKDSHRSQESVEFLYSGDMQALLSVIARGNIQDISITEPDLEEVFLHYYEEGGDEK